MFRKNPKIKYSQKVVTLFPLSSLRTLNFVRVHRVTHKTCFPDWRNLESIFSGRSWCAINPTTRGYWTNCQVTPGTNPRKVARANCHHALARPSFLDGSVRYWKNFYGHTECSRRRRGQYCSPSQWDKSYDAIWAASKIASTGASSVSTARALGTGQDGK